MVLKVRRQTKQITGPKKAAMRDITFTIDQRSTDPTFDTSHNTDTEHGIIAPNTKTTVEIVRIQSRKRAENFDESNMSGGRANSPDWRGYQIDVKEREKTRESFTRNPVNKHVEDIIVTLQKCQNTYAKVYISHYTTQFFKRDCVPSTFHSTIYRWLRTSTPG
jgi:hypothetical protein